MAVTYTKVSTRGVDGSGNRKRSVYDVAYSAEPYSSGVPLDKTKLGAENLLEELLVMDMGPADASLVKYSAATEKLRVYDAAGVEASGTLTRTVRVVAEGY